MDGVTDKVYGCIIGGAIGDSLGGTVEGWPYHKIRDRYGRIDTFRAYDNLMSTGQPGSVTDDSVMEHYISMAIVEKGGRITPDDLADVVLETLNQDRVWITEEIMIQKLYAGLDPWETGQGAVPGGTASMAIAPVGVVNAGDPSQAYQDGYNVASINQEGFNRKAAATVAAGVATAMRPDATATDVIDSMLDHSAESVFRSLDLALDLATSSETVDEFVEQFYDSMLDWQWPGVNWSRERYHRGQVFSASSVEIVPAVVGLIALCEGDTDETIIEGASFGRDCDTIASIAGNIVGALNGASSIREDWIERVETANSDLFEEIYQDPDENFERMAYKLVDALEGERTTTKRRACTLDRILSQ